MDAAKRLLCRLDELQDPGSRGFQVHAGDERREIFVVRKAGQAYAYRNACPHTGASLEWTPDQFLDYDNMFIQCAIHGAIFLIETGECVRGPCVGRHLIPVAVDLVDGELLLAESGIPRRR